jgi:ferredoxin
MADRGPVTITIDRIACDGHGLCAELLPELISLDDWGYPIVAAGPVPEQLVEHARRAVTFCPVLAFHLRAVQTRESMAAIPVARPFPATRPG